MELFLVSPQEISDEYQPQGGYDPNIHVEQKLLRRALAASPVLPDAVIPVLLSDILSVLVQEPDVPRPYLIGGSQLFPDVLLLQQPEKVDF